MKKRTINSLHLQIFEFSWPVSNVSFLVRSIDHITDSIVRYGSHHDGISETMRSKLA